MQFVWAAKTIAMPPATGAESYSSFLIKSLVETGVNGTLVTYASGDSEANFNLPGLTVRPVPQQNRKRVMSLASTLPSDAYRQKSRSFANTFRAAVTDVVDVLVLDYFAMAWLIATVRDVIRASSRSRTIVYVSHNFEQRVRLQVARKADGILMRTALTYDAVKAAVLERKLVNFADLIVAITDDDRSSYQGVAPGKKVITLRPAYQGEVLPLGPIDASLPRRVVISGSFEWIAKRAALKRFVKVADEPFRLAGIELLVVGRIPPDLMSEIRTSSQIAKFAGWVNDLRPVMRNARIGVMPDEVGGGFKQKYLDYIFNGLTVGTIRSQAQGLPLDLDRDVIARDDIDSLVKALVEVIDDLPALEAMRQRAWAACSRTFSSTEGGVLFRKALCELNAISED